MKLLIIASAGDCPLALAMRAMKDGHKVKTFIRHSDGVRSEVGDGIIERVAHWEDHMNWADLIFVTDNNKYIEHLEPYQKKGYPIFGCNVEGASWEQNREVGTEILKRAGIKTIAQTVFSNYDDALKHVISNPTKRYVSKPLGDGNKELSYVSKSGRDMIFMLTDWKKKGGYTGKFVLQDFHEGIEMGVGGWFGINGFSKHWCESFEHKKLMNDELGVSTGEQGTIVRYTEESKLADLVLKPLEGMLHGIGYSGYVDINCIIDKSGTPWPLEFTNRPGWPLFQIQMALHKGDVIEWMWNSLHGKDSLKVRGGVGCGVVISIPDYPYCSRTKKECSGYPLFDLTEEILTGCFYPSDVQMGKAPDVVNGKVVLNVPTYVTAGEYIGTVVAVADNVDGARELCYGNIKKYIEIPNSVGYRTDIGCKVLGWLPELHKMGYAKGLK